MARKRTAAKISTINRAVPSSPALLERYCRGLDGWPRAWMGIEKDVPPGEKLVACFRPFLEELVLVASELSPKTIQKHVDNRWSAASTWTSAHIRVTAKVRFDSLLKP
jgi:hypothetical protein